MPGNYFKKHTLRSGMHQQHVQQQQCWYKPEEIGEVEVTTSDSAYCTFALFVVLINEFFMVIIEGCYATIKHIADACFSITAGGKLLVY